MAERFADGGSADAEFLAEAAFVETQFGGAAVYVHAGDGLADGVGGEAAEACVEVEGVEGEQGDDFGHSAGLAAIDGVMVPSRSVMFHVLGTLYLVCHGGRNAESSLHCSNCDGSVRARFSDSGAVLGHGGAAEDGL